MAWFARKGKYNTQLAFSVTEDGLTAVSTKDSKILFFEHVTLDSSDNNALFKALKKIVSQHQLVNKTCTLTLDFSQYQLLMVDAPDVPEQELAKALKWKVKGLLEYPLDDVVLDAFLIPPHGNAGQRKKAFVAATGSPLLRGRVKLFEHALLKLKSVDIAILSERNVLQLVSNKKGTELFLSYQDNSCFISIYSDGDLYFVRRIDATGITNELGDEKISENVLLELQRSIDYCVSNLKLSDPSRIFLSPYFLNLTSVIDYISSRVSQEVICIDINKCMTAERELTPIAQQQCWYALGASLKQCAIQRREAHATS